MQFLDFKSAKRHAYCTIWRKGQVTHLQFGFRTKLDITQEIFFGFQNFS